MFELLLGQRTPINELIMLKRVKGGGGGEPTVRVRFKNHKMTITGVEDITTIAFENHVLSLT